MKSLLEVVQKAIDEKKGKYPLLYTFSSLNPAMIMSLFAVQTACVRCMR